MKDLLHQVPQISTAVGLPAEHVKKRPGLAPLEPQASIEHDLEDVQGAAATNEAIVNHQLFGANHRDANQLLVWPYASTGGTAGNNGV